MYSYPEVMDVRVKSSARKIKSINYYIGPNKYMCNLLGFWPVDTNSLPFWKYFSYFRLILSLTAVLNVFVPEILALIVYRSDIRILTGVGCVTMTVGQLLFKMIYIIVRRQRMRAMYQIILELWQVTDDPVERRCLERMARHATIFTVFFFFMAVIIVLAFTGAAIFIWRKSYVMEINGTDYLRSLPFEVWYGFDTTSTPNFEIAFVCQILSSVICGTGISGLDGTLMTPVLHVCGQFQLLQLWLQQVGAKIAKIDSNYNLEKEFLNDISKDILKCIQHHQKIIELAAEVETLLNPIIFIQFVTSGLEICLSGYAIFVGVNRMDLIKFTNYLLSMVFQLFIWCWPGEIIIEESNAVADVIFHDVPWYKLPKILQKDLHFMIIRGQKYCRITAAKFQTMSIDQLTNIFKTAGSYFTLLRQVTMEQTGLS